MLMGAAQRTAAAVVAGLGSQGSFVAMNNVVSQSVPHLHVHVVPRTKGDGLRGSSGRAPANRLRGEGVCRAAQGRPRRAEAEPGGPYLQADDVKGHPPDELGAALGPGRGESVPPWASARCLEVAQTAAPFEGLRQAAAVVGDRPRAHWGPRGPRPRRRSPLCLATFVSDSRNTAMGRRRPRRGPR